MIKIFQQQKDFAESDPSSKTLPLNIFDKGYRSTLDAQKEGQRCVQPAFAKSDKRFKANEVIHSAEVAAIRSGNKRAVKLMKHSWFIQRGCRFQTWDLDFVSDMWLAWGFQVNFMFHDVL